MEAAKATLEILLPELGEKIREDSNAKSDADLSVSGYNFDNSNNKWMNVADAVRALMAENLFPPSYTSYP